jgi:hypothetical protein
MTYYIKMITLSYITYFLYNNCDITGLILHKRLLVVSKNKWIERKENNLSVTS